MRKSLVFTAAAISAVSLFSLSNSADAHRRHFIQTYEYQTPYKGEWELETWFDIAINAEDGERQFRSQIELENGTTDRWSNAIYLINSQKKGDGLEFEGLKYETRYRLAEPNRLFLDPAIYFEYKLNSEDDERDEVEGKLILGKDWNNYHFAVNYVAEQELKDGVPTEHGYAIGLARDTSFGSAHVELYGSISEREHVIAPGVAFPLGARKWGIFEVAAPLNGRSGPTQIRTLFEFEW